jgi:hypothetical protein
MAGVYLSPPSPTKKTTAIISTLGLPVQLQEDRNITVLVTCPPRKSLNFTLARSEIQCSRALAQFASENYEVPEFGPTRTRRNLIFGLFADIIIARH